jgi:hypothetical protein
LADLAGAGDALAGHFKDDVAFLEAPLGTAHQPSMPDIRHMLSHNSDAAIGPTGKLRAVTDWIKLAALFNFNRHLIIRRSPWRVRSGKNTGCPIPDNFGD